MTLWIQTCSFKLVLRTISNYLLLSQKINKIFQITVTVFCIMTKYIVCARHVSSVKIILPSSLEYNNRQCNKSKFHQRRANFMPLFTANYLTIFPVSRCRAICAVLLQLQLHSIIHHATSRGSERGNSNNNNISNKSAKLVMTIKWSTGARGNTTVCGWNVLSHAYRKWKWKQVE